MKKRILITAFFIFGAALSPSYAHAARIFLEALPSDKAMGQRFEVRVFADTEGESINAWSGAMRFPSGILKAPELRDGNSAVNFWIDKPAAEGDVIKFAGVTPGGFNGKRGLLFTAVFHSLRPGSAPIMFEEAKFLKNDGRGSPADVSLGRLDIRISANAAVTALIEEDAEPPEDFLPAVSRSDYVFDNQYFVAFSSQDKISGIAGYFIAESPRRRGEPDWAPAASPHILADQGRHSYIFVKAVDRAGNERIAVITPEKGSGTWLRSILIIALLVIGGGFMSKRKWKK